MTITMEEAQRSLPELIANLKAGDELIITQNAQPVAQVLPVADRLTEPIFGRCRGKLIIVSEDDEHLEDFKDYMP